MKRRAFIGGGMAAILASRRAPAFCIAMRNGMMMRPSAPPTPPLPYDYAVEYIETDGVSFIDTGVQISGGGKLFKARFAFVGEAGYSGASTTSTNVLYAVHSGFVQEWCLPNALSPASGLSFDTSGNVFYDIESATFPGAKYAKVNGSVVGTSTSSASVTLAGKTYYISKYATVNDTGRLGKVKCSYFQIFDGNDNCLFDGTSVVSDGVAGMYDSISGTFKGNAAASGTITAGPIV